MLASLPGPFHYVFVQRGVLEILLLSVGAGLLGTWIVLRGLAFYSHAVGDGRVPRPRARRRARLRARRSARSAAALLFALRRRPPRARAARDAATTASPRSCSSARSPPA